tara:strand:+ start:1197 stop:1877 length:681 start_codon:yes stop_codon:yes gene_type:complete
MQWNDVGFLISQNKYNENSSIIEFFTENHGKCTGIVFGSTSKKIKGYLQIGNKLHLNYNYKIESKIGNFKLEICNAYAPLYFDNNKKLSCIISAMNLIKLLTVESQENIKIYNLIENFFLILKSKNWIKKYVFWELKLLELVGYNLDLKKIVNFEIFENKKRYFVESNKEKKYIPSFLIEKNDDQIDKIILFKALKLVGDFLEKNILKPNNINYPSSRLEFIKLLK